MRGLPGRPAVARLGVCVTHTSVHAALVRMGEVLWAGSADFSGVEELGEVFARLAAECTPVPKRARVVLAAGVAQQRTVVPAPALRRSALRRYVSLDSPRLFRKNGVPLVCDAVSVVVPGGATGIRAAAAAEPVLNAILDGCAAAGLRVESLGVTSDVVASALAAPPADSLEWSQGGMVERIEFHGGVAWRSRVVRGSATPGPVGWRSTLEAVGPDAWRYAAAFGAAVARPRLELIPEGARVARQRRGRNLGYRMLAAGLAVWLAVAGSYHLRLARASAAAVERLATLQSDLDSALLARRELSLVAAALDQFRTAEAHRHGRLQLLTRLTGVLDDSTVLTSFSLRPDGTLRLTGFSPQSARVLARVSAISGVTRAAFDGPVVRDQAGGRRRGFERFAISAELESDR
jgi:hypothetical protein